MVRIHTFCFFLTTCITGLCTVNSMVAQAQVVPYAMIGSRPDFSGSWELNYRLSDDWQRQLERKIAKLRRDAEVRARQSRREPRLGQLNLGRGRGGNIIDLARFTDTITRHNTFSITQDQQGVKIEREGDANLICHSGEQSLRSSNEFGAEVCAWDQNRLVFKIVLNQGTVIYHRFLIANDRQSINLQTRVSHQGSDAFDLVQTYDRYQEKNRPYHCQQTLSRGKVCSLRTPQKPKSS